MAGAIQEHSPVSSGIRVEQAVTPLGPMDVSTREQSEDFVRCIRHEEWANHKVRDRGVANARARMTIADIAFDLYSSTDLTPDQRIRATRAIDLIIDARDRLVRTRYGHFGRVQDTWADSVSRRISRRRQARQNETTIVAFR